MIKSRSRKHRVGDKDVIQTRESQHYAQSRHKICEKLRNYYEKKKNVDFIIKKRRRSNKKTKKQNSSKNRIELFTKLIKEGPTYTCVVCNKCMYQKGIKKFDQSK